MHIVFYSLCLTDAYVSDKSGNVVAILFHYMVIDLSSLASKTISASPTVKRYEASYMISYIATVKRAICFVNALSSNPAREFSWLPHLPLFYSSYNMKQSLNSFSCAKLRYPALGMLFDFHKWQKRSRHRLARLYPFWKSRDIPRAGTRNSAREIVFVI